MGNCQAIDNASLAIQHPNGKVDTMYWPIAANHIMKMYPGHYVALLLTTTLYSSAAAATAAAKTAPLRITRIKLLRPTDTLALGHVYRLVTSQDVMKGLLAKKQAKMTGKSAKETNSSSEFELEKKKQDKHERHSSRNKTGAAVIINSTAMSKSRGWQWQPSLRSISEAGS